MHSAQCKAQRTVAHAAQCRELVPTLHNAKHWYCVSLQLQTEMHRTIWHDALLCLIIEGGRCAFLKLLLKTTTQFVIIWMLVSLALIRMVSLALFEFPGKSAKTGTRLLRLASTGSGCRQPGGDKISKELHSEKYHSCAQWVETESGWTAPPIHYPSTAIQV